MNEHIQAAGAESFNKFHKCVIFLTAHIVSADLLSKENKSAR